MSVAKDDASAAETVFADRPFPFAVLHDVNERCLELLTFAARNETRPTMPLVTRLRPLLRNATPEIRRRVAARGFLLVDMAFHDVDWWRGVRRQPQVRWRTHGFHESFPRRTAVPLARSTLMLAWYSVQADLDTACVLLGMTREVAEAIAQLPLSELDRLADRRHRHVLPRWHEDPAFWHELFTSAQSGSANTSRLVNLHALQLLTGPLLSRSAARIGDP